MNRYGRKRSFRSPIHLDGKELSNSRCWSTASKIFEKIRTFNFCILQSEKS